MKLLINSDKAFIEAQAELKRLYDEHKYIKLNISTGKQRTLTQNGALHLYCQMVADSLNEHQIDFTMFFKDGLNVSWTGEIVKNEVWRPVQLAMTQKESTAKAHISDYSLIYDYVNRKLSDWGIYVPWPSKDHSS